MWVSPARIDGDPHFQRQESLSARTCGRLLLRFLFRCKLSKQRFLRPPWVNLNSTGQVIIESPFKSPFVLGEFHPFADLGLILRGEIGLSVGP